MVGRFSGDVYVCTLSSLANVNSALVLAWQACAGRRICMTERDGNVSYARKLLTAVARTDQAAERPASLVAVHRTMSQLSLSVSANRHRRSQAG